jgi:hypothetical protein
MAKLSTDLGSPRVLHPRENLFVTGNLGALNAEVVTPCDGASSVTLDLQGTFNLTVEVSGSVDGTNYTLIPMRRLNAASVLYVAGIAGTSVGQWIGNCAGYRFVRARATVYSSGAATANLVVSNAMYDPNLMTKITPSTQTAVGASGAAVTLTIASPGAGLRHYLTYLSITRYAAAVLTASATPVTVTTTNLPGALAFTFPADAAALGTVDRWREDFAYAIASSAQATATTIVCPVTTGVIWRVTAGFYVAP